MLLLNTRNLRDVTSERTYLYENNPVFALQIMRFYDASVERRADYKTILGRNSRKRSGSSHWQNTWENWMKGETFLNVQNE